MWLQFNGLDGRKLLFLYNSIRLLNSDCFLISVGNQFLSHFFIISERFLSSLTAVQPRALVNIYIEWELQIQINNACFVCAVVAIRLQFFFSLNCNQKYWKLYRIKHLRRRGVNREGLSKFRLCNTAHSLQTSHDALLQLKTRDLLYANQWTSELIVKPARSTTQPELKSETLLQQEICIPSEKTKKGRKISSAAETTSPEKHFEHTLLFSTQQPI